MYYLIIILLLFLLVGTILAIYSFKEAHDLKITFAKLTKSNTNKHDTSSFIQIEEDYKDYSPIVKTSKDSLKVLFFSDLHIEYCFIPVSTVISVIDDAIANYNIDAVIFGGDLCNKPKNVSKAHAYIDTIAEHLKSKGIPFLGTTGNHDADVDAKLIDVCSFVNLNKTPVTIKNFELRGIYDSGRDDRVWEENPFTTHEHTNILVSHNPDWLLYASECKSLNNIDYMLSGHIHGGQIRMPWGLENTLFRKDILPKKNKVVKGVFDGVGVKFFISRGIGCILVPFRFLAPPEITVVEIE